MQAKTKVPPAPPGTPAPSPDLREMDHIHHMVAGDHLAKIFVRLGKRK